MDIAYLRKILIEKGLKITPQRLIVLEAVKTLNNHPTADNVMVYIKNNHPNIAIGTIYNILDTFVEFGILRKVNTEKDIMRYDPILENHHHLYSGDSNRIEDYFDNDLDLFLKKYFTKKNIPGFEIENIKLQIKGKFKP
jgi:Fur family peroxide stress response transcriptional regulator